MTKPTDPRVEAAAREMCLSAVDGDERIWDEMSERDKNFYRRRCILILRAADEAAWRPIEDVKDCPLAALIEQGSDEGPYIGSCRDGVWCDGLDMVEPTHYMPFPAPPEATP